jgi:hypothetical protein
MNVVHNFLVSGINKVNRIHDYLVQEDGAIWRE